MSLDWKLLFFFWMAESLFVSSSLSNSLELNFKKKEKKKAASFLDFTERNPTKGFSTVLKITIPCFPSLKSWVFIAESKQLGGGQLICKDRIHGVGKPLSQRECGECTLPSCSLGASQFSPNDPTAWCGGGLVTVLAIDNVVRKKSFPRPVFWDSVCDAKEKTFCQVYVQLLLWLRQWRIHLQWGRPGFDPWVRKILWRRAWQPTPVFLPRESPWTGEPGGLQSMESQRAGHNWWTKHNIKE